MILQAGLLLPATQHRSLLLRLFWLRQRWRALEGLGFWVRVWGLGFGLRVYGLGFRVHGLRV